MQNAPAMLAQKMMSRQAAYAPVGMVSQNMSGNKKGGAGGGGAPVVPGGVIGLVFDTTSASPGVTFSNGNITARNLSGPQTYASAKSSAGSIAGASGNFYLEFIVGNTSDQQFGFARSDFASNHADSINNIVGGLSAVPSFAYRPSTGTLSYGGTGAFSTIVSAITGDVIGITANWSGPSFTINVFKNNVNILLNLNASGSLSGGSSFVAAWSSRAVGSFSTLYNSIYVQAGFTPLGSSPDTLAASASVTPVADGAYDVYTFNASGTFTVASTGAVRALVIAGGGRGDNAGGGAGGYKEQSVIITPQTYAITVGAGGSGQGGDSSLGSLFITTGGGVGGTATVSARNGGSSGGGYKDGIPNDWPTGTAVSGQGNVGGTATYPSGIGWAGAGGGGAGGVGGNATGSAAGNGGAGLSSSITGISVARGGGGGGYSYDGTSVPTGITVGTASAGGGAAPSQALWQNSVAGTPNTGGGGYLVSGGSGVVIIRVRARA